MKHVFVYLFAIICNIPAIISHEWWGFLGLGFTIGMATAHLIARIADHA